MTKQNIWIKNLSPEDLSELKLGIHEFNNQQFFQCHETLEKIWLKQQGDEKQLLQGLIQLAVGYHHMLQGNKVGALKLLRRGLSRIIQHSPPEADPQRSQLVEAVQNNIDELNNNSDCQPEEIMIPRVDLSI